MKFTTLLAVLLLPWAIVGGSSPVNVVSIGKENSPTLLLLVTKQNNSSLGSKTNLTFCRFSFVPNNRLMKLRLLMKSFKTGIWHSGIAEAAP
jgi:hypothetical protein